MHHTLVHGEQLPNQTCANCGDEFHANFTKKFCSEPCRREQVGFEAEANPNYRDAKESTACEICGTLFEYYPSEKAGRFCPDCVESEPWQSPPLAEGPDHPRWKGGKVRRACVVCGGFVERYPSGFVSEVVLCSESCRGKWLSGSFEGEGHPNWKGGGNEEYGSGWRTVRKKALERDGYQCVVCGVTRTEMGRNPDVHHIVPVRRFAGSEVHEVEDAHRLDNVVSLCISCHRKAEFGKISRETLRTFIGD